MGVHTCPYICVSKVSGRPLVFITTTNIRHTVRRSRSGCLRLDVLSPHPALMTYVLVWYAIDASQSTSASALIGSQSALAVVHTYCPRCIFKPSLNEDYSTSTAFMETGAVSFKVQKINTSSFVHWEASGIITATELAK